MNGTSLKFAVVILGAGASTRMGRPKLLLPWSGTTVVTCLLQQWTALGASQVAVVLRDDDHALKDELRRSGVQEPDWIVNPQPGQGMFSSVRAASAWDRWRTGISHFVISLGDQPQIRRVTLDHLLEFAAANPTRICQPRLRGRVMHPIIFPAPQFCALAATDRQTLRDFLESAPDHRAFFDSTDESLALDLDSPREYQQAITQFAANPH